jgi:hypothetical protein
MTNTSTLQDVVAAPELDYKGVVPGTRGPHVARDASDNSQSHNLLGDGDSSNKTQSQT